MNKLKLRHLFVSMFFILIPLGLVSCAGGLAYNDIKNDLPKIQNGKGRVFVYRPSSMGFAVKPKIKIDGNIVGVSEGKGFLYSDQSPGQHTVSTSTEWKHNATVYVSKGQPTFVRCSVFPGLLAAHIVPKQVEQAKGQREIQNCKLKKAQ